MRGTKEIIKKELNRVFMDKKLVFSLFILPVVLMIGLFGLINNMQTSMLNDIEAHESIIYIQNKPEGLDDIMDQLQFTGKITYLDIVDSTDALKDGIKNGTVDLLVVFEPDFEEVIQNYEEGGYIPGVRTFYNTSEDYSSKAREAFVNSVLHTYQQDLLLKRIGNLDNITIFRIDDIKEQDEPSVLVNEEKAAGKMLGMMLPYFITMLLFAGAMSLGVDAITGEKERGTLASMLVTPIKRSEIVMGKIISLTILSCLSAAIYAGSLTVAMPAMMGEQGAEISSGLGIRFSAIQVIQLLLIMLSLVFFYVAIVALVSVFARTAKEASTYVSPIYIIVIVAGMITMFQGNNTPNDLLYIIPMYGNALSIQSLLVGELTALQFALSLGGTIAVTVVLIAIITKAFNSEKVMFNA